MCAPADKNNLVAEARSLVVQAVDRATVRLGFGHSQERLVDDAKAYWVDGMAEPTWRGFSHFRGAGVFETTADWTPVGREHWDLFQRLERVRGTDDLRG